MQVKAYDGAIQECLHGASMKILFLSSQVPYPPNTPTRDRIFNLIKSVASSHEITLCCFVNNEPERNQLRVLLPYCYKVIPLAPRKMSNLDFLKLFFINIFSFKPISIQKNWSPSAYRDIQEIIKTSRFDLIHCEGLEMAQYISAVKDIPKMLSLSRIESIVQKRLAYISRSKFKRRFLIWQWHKIRRYEEFADKFIDIWVVASKADKKALEEFLPDAWIEEIPNGIDSEIYKIEMETRGEETKIVLPFSLQNNADEETLRQFFTQIWPIVKMKHNQAKLYVVGREQDERMKQFEKAPDVFISEKVQDIRPIVADSRVVVVPQGKNCFMPHYILEALAMGKTVVTTSELQEDLELENGKEVVVADEPDMFAKNLVYLLDNQDMSQHLGLRARSVIEKKYDWKVLSNRLKNLYEMVSSK